MSGDHRLLPYALERFSLKITIYQKPTCTTYRQVYAALKDSGVEFENVDHYVAPIPTLTLIELLMVTHPDLIQRPIVAKGARAILARPADRLKEILDKD